MNNKNITVTLTDADNKIVGEFIIKRLNVAANARRLSMTSKIIDLEIEDAEKGQLLSCAALASTLHDKDGELIYPEKDGANTIFESMDIEIYDALCAAYIEVNPLEPTLKAKKKKS